MKITFCGHSSFIRTQEYENKILNLFEEIIGDNNVEFLLGGYGNFDNFAFECCKKYKETHPSASLTFVTPYITESYQTNRLQYQKDLFDHILYPPIEQVPPKFAIIYRNKYMVDNSDFVIAFISRKFGGAYKTYSYAEKNKKAIYNIYKKDL